MSDQIKPALAPEEWAEREFESRYALATTSAHIDHKSRLFVSSEMPTDDEAVVVFNESYETAPLHKLAALCLYGQPFGFSPEGHRALRAMLDHAERWINANWLGHDWRLHELAKAEVAKISALLPPETP